MKPCVPDRHIRRGRRTSEFLKHLDEACACVTKNQKWYADFVGQQVVATRKSSCWARAGGNFASLSKVLTTPNISLCKSDCVHPRPNSTKFPDEGLQRFPGPRSLSRRPEKRQPCPSRRTYSLSDKVYLQAENDESASYRYVVGSRRVVLCRATAKYASLSFRHLRPSPLFVRHA